MGREAYLRREICVSKLIGLALYLEGNLPFLLCFTLYLRAISKYNPPGGGLYLEGRFNGRFFCVTSLGGLYLEGLIHGGAYFRNFTVSIPCHSCQYWCPSLFCFKTTVFYLAFIISVYFIAQHLLIILFDKIIRL